MDKESARELQRESFLISVNEYTNPKSNSIPQQTTVLAFGSKVSFKGTGLAASAACLGELVNSSSEKSDKKKPPLCKRQRENPLQLQRALN